MTNKLENVKEKLFQSLDDIKAIIDDAMEKGDRSVQVSVIGDSVTLIVSPYKDDDMGEWKYSHNAYSCSICNNAEEWCKPYCPNCGAKMKLPGVEGE